MLEAKLSDAVLLKKLLDCEYFYAFLASWFLLTAPYQPSKNS